jgi:FPC/CPF motif-containing protein YcgG
MAYLPLLPPNMELGASRIKATMNTQRANPFSSTEAAAHSCYTAFVDNRLVLPLEGGRSPPPLARRVHKQLRSFILDSAFPCAGAKAAFSQETYRFGMYPEMASTATAAALSRDLFTFVQEQPHLDSDFTSFIASFSGPTPTTEEQFERLLWRQLQNLNDIDAHHHSWDPSYDSNPESPQFSFSFAGLAFFVVGLHPVSSRLSRRFPWPTLVFNARYQFSRLEASGKYQGFRGSIRRKDAFLQGSLNPNLKYEGKDSEARQYSGRAVEENWKCPFKPTSQRPP